MMIMRNIKRTAIIVAVSLVPLLFCVNVWQSFRYSSLKRDIARLEALQQDLLEQNKRNIAGMAVLESPGRIDELGQKALGLKRPGTESYITVQPRQGAQPDTQAGEQPPRNSQPDTPGEPEKEAADE